jgi:hypothetical protein
MGVARKYQSLHVSHSSPTAQSVSDKDRPRVRRVWLCQAHGVPKIAKRPSSPEVGDRAYDEQRPITKGLERSSQIDPEREAFDCADLAERAKP